MILLTNWLPLRRFAVSLLATLPTTLERVRKWEEGVGLVIELLVPDPEAPLEPGVEGCLEGDMRSPLKHKIIQNSRFSCQQKKSQAKSKTLWRFKTTLSTKSRSNDYFDEVIS